MFTSKLWEKCRFHWVEMQVVVVWYGWLCYMWVSVLNRKDAGYMFKFFAILFFSISRIGGRTERYMLFVTLVLPESRDRKTPPPPQPSQCRASFIQYMGLIVSLPFLLALSAVYTWLSSKAYTMQNILFDLFMIINHLKRYPVWNEIKLAFSSEV